MAATLNPKGGPWRWYRHRPGPWQCFLVSDDEAAVGDRVVLALREDWASWPHVTTTAAARLIESAPDLLLALIAADAALRNHPGGDCRSEADIEAARAVIEKVKGGKDNQKCN